jgi:hypothetical protein
MSNFCPHCGTAVSASNATNCFSCGKLLSGSSETTKNDSFNDAKEKLFNFAKNVKDLSIKASADLRSDETKAKIKDFANQAQSFATEKTKDLKEEFEKINEARKATANESKDFESTSKVENSKVIVQSFWSKLSGKQKGLFIGFPLFLFVCFMAVMENSVISDKEARDIISSTYQMGMCKQEEWFIAYKLREINGTLGSMSQENSIVKKASDEWNSYIREFDKENIKDGKLNRWLKSDPIKPAILNYMMSIDNWPCPTRKSRGLN